MKTLTNKWYEEVRQGPSGSEDEDDEAELLWDNHKGQTEMRLSQILNEPFSHHVTNGLYRTVKDSFGFTQNSMTGAIHG